MLYPDKLVEVQVGFVLFVPDPELVKLTYESLLMREPSTPFPYWAKIWPSSKAMCSFLEAEPAWIAGKRVLEIGAGIGLPSLVMAHRAAEMIISDYATEAVALLNKNIQYLHLKQVRAMVLDWNDFPDNLQCETILMSDINYAPDQFDPLLKLVQQLLGQGATIIISTPQRIMATPFVKALQPNIQRTVLQTVEEKNQLVDISILVLSL